MRSTIFSAPHVADWNYQTQTAEKESSGHPCRVLFDPDSMEMGDYNLKHEQHLYHWPYVARNWGGRFYSKNTVMEWLSNFSTTLQCAEGAGENHGTPVRIANVRTETWKRHLPNTKLECYPLDRDARKHDEMSVLTVCLVQRCSCRRKKNHDKILALCVCWWLIYTFLM